MTRTLGLTIAAALVIGGCGTQTRSWLYTPPLLRSAGAELPARERLDPAPPRPPGPAAPLERALTRRGLRFGTDGSVGAIYGYMRASHRKVAAADARAGDLVFFDLAGDGCGTHGGVVESADASGRITFREWRDGALRTSHAAPAEPRTRRDTAGRVLNTFLRPKRGEDREGTRYFAGEMLCAVMRVK